MASSDCNISITITQFQCTDYFYRRAIYLIFFCGRFWNYFWVPGSMLSCFSAFCFSFFSACLLVCFTCFFSFFSASLLSLLLCFCALPASFIFCFSAFPCFSASSLCYLFVFSFLLLYSLLFVNTLGETQRNLKEILIRTPDKKLT